MPKDKTNNFLKAINKYAKQQKYAMRKEVKMLKTERLKEAEEKAKHDSECLIKEKYSEKQAQQTALLASKTQQGQKKLFIERSAMMEEVFSLTAQKLTDYTKTEKYEEKLEQSAKEIAELFGDRDCVIYISENDADKTAKLKPYFTGKTDFQTDKTIKLGGLRGCCESMGIIADETLDSKLDAQKEWFTENAALSVL